MNINWYPGHMTKARRMMEENIKLVDVVIELLDARAPLSTRNPDIDDLAITLLHESPAKMLDHVKRTLQIRVQHSIEFFFRQIASDFATTD